MKKTILVAIFSQAISISAFAGANDPLFSKQWAMENSGQISLKYLSELERTPIKGTSGMDINWVDTKNIQTTKKELIVAVLDSGVDINHPDLKGRIWFNEALCAGATNPAAKACNGYNYLENNTLLTDDMGHGTHVAGIIAAVRDNNLGIAGAADPRIKIMPMKILNSEVKGFTYNGKVITDVIADAMTFAVKNGAEVINLSLGWPKLIDLAKVKKAFDYAEENNVTVIAATGNNSKDLPTFPCSYENVICVGAVDNQGKLSDFTNHGAKVDVVAPGESIISTYPTKLESRVLRIKNYESKRGSSQAAPYVAAAVANLKLLYPGLTNDQVRNLVFKSSRKLAKDKNGRFTKFGMLDMKELLHQASEIGKVKEVAFINPQIKSLTEVKFDMATRNFAFNLDLKNLSGVDYQGLLCLKVFSTAIELDQSCVKLESILAHKILSVPVTGSISNMGSDSHILMQIQIDENLYQTSLVFSRDLNTDAEIVVNQIGKASFEDMALLNADRRLSRLSRVFDQHKRIGSPEYFYLERLKQTETETKISLLTREAGSYVVKNITLPKANKVVSIHRQDINLDGKMDYFVYALSNKKNEILFYIYDEKLNPLFKNYPVWRMPLSTFEGLPIEAGQEKFQWIKIKQAELGNILVPSIYRAYTMPEADNSKIISERVLGAMSHQYYLNPVVSGDKMGIELRVVDSVKMMKALRKQVGIIGFDDVKTLTLLKPFPQTVEEVKNGEFRSLFALEEEGVVKLFQTTLLLSGNNFLNVISLASERGMEQSLIYPIVSTKTGAITEESIFTALLNRTTAEFLSKKDNEIGSILKLQQDWEDPIIALSAIFDQGSQKTYLVENRSSMVALRANGEKTLLPIYRDSSFPGQNFSETLVPVLSEGRPGMYVNSTLIYGERIYSMIDTEDKGFVRPLRLSIDIPEGCVPLEPETLGDNSHFNYVFLCTDAEKNVSLKFLPMSHL